MGKDPNSGNAASSPLRRNTYTPTQNPRSFQNVVSTRRPTVPTSTASSTTSHSTTMTVRDFARQQPSVNHSTRSGDPANRVPLAAKVKFYIPPAFDGKRSQAAERVAPHSSASLRRS